MTNERRRSPRIEILGRLYGHVVSLGLPIVVVEMSLGGCAIQTAIEFPLGAVHEFNLTLGDGSSVVVRGQAVHSKNVAAEDEEPSYLTGIQFIDDDGTEGGDTTVTSASARRWRASKDVSRSRRS